MVCLLFAVLYKGDIDPVQRGETRVAPPPMVSAPEVNPWRAAARLVEEDRGEPMGRAARARVPSPLLHYDDRKRFLAIQVAGWREHEFALPHDDAELVEMIRRDEMVEVPPLGEDYILYGVGANATEGPLFHYDARSRSTVPLYPRYDLYEDEAGGWTAQAEERRTAAKDLEAQLRKVPARERRRRTALRGEIRKAREEASALDQRRRRLDSWYKDYDRRRFLVAEWHLHQEQARGFKDRVYDLDSPRERRAYRARLLSFLRPSARDVLFGIAAWYKGRFGRPLAVTSLVRTEEYQRHLGESNPNATRIDVPPHTTGLAFDIYYRYMSAGEQEELMGHIADLESAGRLEALRENRDHFHLFAFADGRRPSEALIADSRELIPTRVAAPKKASAGRKGRAVRSRGTSGRRTAAVRPRSGGTARRTSAPVNRTRRARGGARGGSR